MNVSLTPKLENFVKAKVKTGDYNNASEVVREALRLLQKEEAVVEERKAVRLRKALRAGIAGPDADSFDMKKVIKRLRRRTKA
jgi:antitoxin ParD1/3/4